MASLKEMGDTISQTILNGRMKFHFKKKLWFIKIKSEDILVFMCNLLNLKFMFLPFFFCFYRRIREKQIEFIRI